MSDFHSFGGLRQRGTGRQTKQGGDNLNEMPWRFSFKPSRCIKASFLISEEWFNFLRPGMVVLEQKFL